MKSLKMVFHSGKNPKFPYYVGKYMQKCIPLSAYRLLLKVKLKNVESRSDWDIIQRRVNYYNKLSERMALPLDSPTVGHQAETSQKVYKLDTDHAIHWFDPKFHYMLIPSDVTEVPDIPSFVKSRPIHGDNANSVLLKLNKIRHFIFVNDKTPWEKKKDMALFRGKVKGKKTRLDFMRMYYGNSRCDVGDVSRKPEIPEWYRPKLTIWEQLEYKFVLSLEGNDVASNLKWIMSSNSLAIMPEPTYETWFMEGTLIPDYHYVRIKSDYSDLEERMDYYLQHPEKAHAIIRHANEYVSQFKNRECEEIIEILVAQKYFAKTNGVGND